MVTVNEAFAKNLKRERARFSWTQQKLASHTSLTTDWISHYECGRRVPNIEHLVELADALGVTTDTLLKR